MGDGGSGGRWLYLIYSELVLEVWFGPLGIHVLVHDVLHPLLLETVCDVIEGILVWQDGKSLCRSQCINSPVHLQCTHTQTHTTLAMSNSGFTVQLLYGKAKLKLLLQTT